jgi:hypothetical protein
MGWHPTMSLQAAMLAFPDLASASLTWLQPISLATIVAMVLLELGKSFPADHRYRRLADRITRPLVVLAIGVILVSGFRLAAIIGFVG